MNPNTELSGPSSGFRYKYPLGHKYHRSDEDMARDLSAILNLPITLKTKEDVIESFLWAWSERFGKHGGCRHSVNASEYSAKQGYRGLIHDHSVPKKLIKAMILDINQPTKEQIAEILENYCEGVIITKEEDARLNKAKLRSRMPENWDKSDVDARYKAVGIDIEERVH